MAEQTVYLNGFKKLKSTSFGGVKVSIKVEDFIKELQSHVNEAGYVNLEIAPRKSPDKFGNDMYGKLDTWKPNKDYVPKAAAKPEDDLPF